MHTFREALEVSRVIMFSAPAGCGKTRVARELLSMSGRPFREVSCKDADVLARVRDASEECDSAGIGAEPGGGDILGGLVLVDDYDQLSERAGEELVSIMEGHPLVQFVICGQCAVPGWVSYLEAMGLALVIETEDLLIDLRLLDRALENRRVELSREQREHLLGRSSGYSLTTLGVVQHLELLPRDERGWVHPDDADLDAAIEVVAFRFYTYLESVRRRRFDERQSDYLMALSPFESFDSDLAEAVVGDSSVRGFLSELQHTTSWLFSDTRGTKRLWPPFRRYLFRCMQRDWPAARRNQIFLRAGTHYEQRDNIALAAWCYKLCDESDRIVGLLARNAREDPMHGSYRELEDSYRTLPQEEVMASTDLMAGMSVLSMLRCDFDESDRWHDLLVARSQDDAADEAERLAARRQVDYLDLALPQRPIDSLEGGLVALAGSVEGGARRRFSITGGLPSVLDGGRDFSRWTLDGKVSYEKIKRPASLMLGRDGVGLAKCTVLESRLERGEDVAQLGLDLASELTDVHAKGTPEVEFVMIGLLARVQASRGDASGALKMLGGFRHRLVSSGEKTFLANVDAMRCRLALLSGDEDLWHAWVQNVDYSSVRELWVLDRFVALTLGLAQIADGQPAQAILTLSPWEQVFERCGRTVDLMEQRLFMAIALWRVSQTEDAVSSWVEPLRKALDTAQELGYVERIASLGVAVLPLLELVSWDGDSAFMERLLRLTRKFARMYPCYLCEGGVGAPSGIPELTKAEMHVLELLGRDFSNARICEELGIKLPTVKSHVMHIMKKLGASSRGQAKTIAQELGLL